MGYRDCSLEQKISVARLANAGALLVWGSSDYLPEPAMLSQTSMTQRTASVPTPPVIGLSVDDATTIRDILQSSRTVSLLLPNLEPGTNVSA